MKRHLALIKFSREHHNALILAQILKKNGPNYKNLPADDEGKRTYTLAFLKTDLAKHFQLEEEILFTYVERRNKHLTGQTAILIEEHKQITKLINHLPKTKNLEYTLNQIGALLENHIRFEEREYFQKVEELLSEKELNELAELFSTPLTNS